MMLINAKTNMDAGGQSCLFFVAAIHMAMARICHFLQT